MFCASGLNFGGIEGVRFRFDVLRARNSFLALPSSSGPVYMFCAPGLIFFGTEVIRSHFHVLRALTHFRWYRGCLVPFSCFALSDSLSAIPKASGPVFMFYAPGTHFRKYRGRRVPFSCFAHPDSFSVVPRLSGPVFMFCAHRLIFGGTEGVASRFQVLYSRTHFRRYRGCRVPFSCFTLTDSFSAIPRVSGPVFMFCTPLIRFRRYRGRRASFSCFARPDLFSAIPRWSDLVFMFSAPEYVFGSTESVGSLFHDLRSRTRFWWYRGRRVLFSCFARSDYFSTVPRSSGPVFMFCAPGLVFGCSEGV
jgi:hypothetical protein